MRIMVTGGAGFIASHVAQAYVDAGHEVLVLDNLSSGKRRTSRGSPIRLRGSGIGNRRRGDPNLPAGGPLPPRRAGSTCASPWPIPSSTRRRIS